MNKNIIYTIGFLACFITSSAMAQMFTLKECRSKYDLEKNSSKMNFYEFRKAKCMGTGESPSDAVAPSTSDDKKSEKGDEKSQEKIVFPNEISPQFAKEKPGTARMRTCAAQYKANKSTGGNGNLPWLQRGGGGYWSQCSKKLKK